MRILLVDSSPASASLTIGLLEATRAIVDPIDTGEEALELAPRYDYDVVLVQAALADMSSAELVRRIRAARIATPVMVLAEASSAQERIKNFGAGADDVITAAVDAVEMLARMQAIVRRSKGFSQSVLSVGNLQLDLNSREVSVGGRPVHLTGKEYAIVELLVLRKGVTLTKDAFLSHLYGGVDEPEVKIIDVFVCKVRKKLAAAGAGDVIATVWGRGYMVRDRAGAFETSPGPFMASTGRMLEVAAAA